MTTIDLHTTKPTRREHTEDHTNLPNAHDPKATKRRQFVERRLEAAVYHGAMFSAHLIGERYYLVDGSGSIHEGLSLKEADLVASFALSAFREGRATA